MSMLKNEPVNPPPLDIEKVLEEAEPHWAAIYRLAAIAVRGEDITDIDRIEFRRCQATAMVRCAESERGLLGSAVEQWIKITAYRLLTSNGDDFDIPPRYQGSVDGLADYDDDFIDVHKSLFGKPWKPKEFDDEEDAFRYWRSKKSK